jgi:DTW domain-containing protein
MCNPASDVVARGDVIDSCERCRRPLPACVCDRTVALETARRVLILQHPQEQDALLGTAQLVTASLPKAKLVVGLSWKNLAHALDEEVDARRWALVFPEREGSRAPADPGNLEGIVVLDGTWSKAKTLYWRNPWLGRLDRLSLDLKEPSIYGKLRREPRRGLVSTLESVGAALTLTGEPPEVEQNLKRLFRTLVQRVRDAKLLEEAKKG